jgi:hypothetical protein
VRERERERERERDYREWIDFFFLEWIGIVVAIHGEKLDPKKMCEENGENDEAGERRLRENHF